MQQSNKNMIIVIILGMFFGVLTLFRGTDILGISLSLVIFGAVIFSLYYFINDRVLRNILIFAFIIRFLLALINVYSYPLPGSTADALTFERVAWEHAQNWQGNNVEISRGSNAFFYSKILSFIYVIFGRIPIILHMANVIMGVLIVLYIYKSTNIISKSTYTSNIAAIITAIYPGLALNSAILLRENFIVFFATLSFYFFLQWIINNCRKRYILSIFTIIISVILHGGMLPILIVYLLSLAIYSPKSKSWNLFNLKRIAIVLLSTFIGFMLLGDIVINKVPINIPLNELPDRLTKVVDSAARDSAAYLVGYTPNTIFDIIKQTPIRAIFLLLAPFPWMVNSSTHLIGLFDSLLFICILYLSLKGLGYLWRKDKVVCIILIAMLMGAITLFAWGTSNFGTGIRHRHKIVCFFIILASIGLTKFKTISKKTTLT